MSYSKKQPVADPGESETISPRSYLTPSAGWIDAYVEYVVLGAIRRL